MKMMKMMKMKMKMMMMMMMMMMMKMVQWSLQPKPIRHSRALMRISLALLLCLAQPSLAAQAPWYWWQSSVTGKQICRQNSPGEGWQQLSQPYLDARCQRPRS